MTDKQQIEELRKFISQLCCNSNCDNCKWRSVEEGSCLDYFEATALYNAGYRKVPKNAIVLTNEKLELGEWKGEVQVMNMARQTYDTCLKQVRRETAKDFIFKVESYLGYNADNETFTKKELLLILAEVAKEQYGVEMK